MFYKILKNFFLKKNVTKRLQNQQPLLEQQKIETIGLLVDETYFSNTASLVEAILSQGFRKEQITILVYKDKIKSKEVISEPFLSLKNISLSGEINKPEVVDFLEKPFDLLINYYDTEKAALLLVSQLSKANFKVGFSVVDKRLNHFMIDTNAENYKIFVSELFKYLRILNKI